MTKPPKRNLLKQKHKEDTELTKAINADNEEHFAATASSAPGGKLSVVRKLKMLSIRNIEGGQAGCRICWMDC